MISKPSTQVGSVPADQHLETVLGPVDAVLAAFSRGEIVVVTDDSDREGEGDLIVAGDSVTPAQLAFVLRHTSGIICAALAGEVADALDLPPMVEANSERHQTAFTVTVDALEGTTTGISAHDRAVTIRTLADPGARPGQLSRPGHVFPLRARPGGVLERRGHTEAAVDLARLSGRAPVAAICELMADDGSAMTLAGATAFAATHRLAACSVADLVAYRRLREPHDTSTLRSPAVAEPVVSSVSVVRESEARVPRETGDTTVLAYRSTPDDREHVAVVVGDPAGHDVLVRVHSECFTGDVLGSARCDCGPQLEAALDEIAAAGRGVVVYQRGHEGRGIGLASKLDAYRLQDGGLDTVDANLMLGLPVDDREYEVAVRILEDLGVRDAQVMTNNPAKIDGLVACGLNVTRRVPLVAESHPEAAHYMETKRRRMGHLLPDHTSQGISCGCP